MHAFLRMVLAASLLMLAAPVFAVDFPCADNETNCSGEAPPTDVRGDGYGSGTNFKPPTTETAPHAGHGTCKGDGTDACQTQASCTYIYD